MHHSAVSIFANRIIYSKSHLNILKCFRLNAYVSKNVYVQESEGLCVCGYMPVFMCVKVCVLMYVCARTWCCVLGVSIQAEYWI